MTAEKHEPVHYAWIIQAIDKRAAKLSAAQLVVLFTIASHFSKSRHDWGMTMDRLAAEVGMAPRHVARIVAALRARGLLVVESGKHHIANRYRLHAQELSALPQLPKFSPDLGVSTDRPDEVPPSTQGGPALTSETHSPDLGVIPEPCPGSHPSHPSLPTPIPTPPQRSEFGGVEKREAEALRAKEIGIIVSRQHELDLKRPRDRLSIAIDVLEAGRQLDRMTLAEALAHLAPNEAAAAQ